MTALGNTTLNIRGKGCSCANVGVADARACSLRTFFRQQSRSNRSRCVHTRFPSNVLSSLRCGAERRLAWYTRGSTHERRIYTQPPEKPCGAKETTIKNMNAVVCTRAHVARHADACVERLCAHASTEHFCWRQSILKFENQKNVSANSRGCTSRAIPRGRFESPRTSLPQIYPTDCVWTSSAKPWHLH